MTYRYLNVICDKVKCIYAVNRHKKNRLNTRTD